MGLSSSQKLHDELLFHHSMWQWDVQADCGLSLGEGHRPPAASSPRLSQLLRLIPALLLHELEDGKGMVLLFFLDVVQGLTQLLVA